MAAPGSRVVAVVLALLAANGLFAWLTFRGQAGSVGPEAVAQAAERTSTSDGLRFSLLGEMELPEVGSVSFTGSGAVDVQDQRGYASMDMSALARQAGAPGANQGDWTMEMVFDRRFVYMKFGLLGAMLGGKSWLGFDLERVSEALGIDSSLLRSQQQQGADPASTLRFLKAVSDDVEEVGTEQVRGVESTHYRATVDLSSFPGVAELGGDDEMEMEVWVGRDNLIRRVKWSQSIKPQGTDQSVDASFTSEYFDFGTEVNVDPPSAHDVQDMTETVAAQLGAGR
ncbi:MAG TPA: hypothetical protein VHG69_02365 [Thermoleophilaceae bacterium]|nr:hypothetical protein [Thermoleophilaceae bacterium]